MHCSDQDTRTGEVVRGQIQQVSNKLVGLVFDLHPHMRPEKTDVPLNVESILRDVRKQFGIGGHHRALPAGAFAGWDLHPLESAALSRRTPIGDIGRACSPILLCCVLARRRAQAKINRRASFRCCGGRKMPAMLPYHQYPIPQRNR